MKNLLIAFFLLISVSSFAQTTYTFATYDPLQIIAPDNSNTHIIQCTTNRETDVLIKFRSGNAGGVKINVAGSTITSSPILSATDCPSGIVVRTNARTGYKIYLRFVTAGDTVVVSKWN